MNSSSAGADPRVGGRAGRPVEVCYLLPNLESGGTERHLLSLVRRIDRARFSPRVVTLFGGGPIRDDIEAAGVPVHTLSPGGGGVWRTFRELLRMLRSLPPPDILHAYLQTGDIYGAAAAKTLGIPVFIASKRAMCGYKTGHPLLALLESEANRVANAVMVNSRAVAEDVRRTERHLDNKMFLVYNGIDAHPAAEEGEAARPPADLKLPPGAPLVSYAANIRDGKGHACLVEAARRVVARIPSAVFLLVGREDGEAAAVRRQIGSMGLERSVLLTGSRSDVGTILASSRLVAHPGWQEGLSNAILEAMAAGKPVIAARAGGNPETVADGLTGLLVEPGDPAGFAEAILRLLLDPGKAREMGLEGRRRAAEEFPLSRMVSSIERTYEELLDGRPLSCAV